ncbi:hypothetical protein [Spirosoma gilvum]
MNYSLLAVLLLLTLFMGCKTASTIEPAQPEQYATSPTGRLVSRDTIRSGGYLDIRIRDAATTVYGTVQTLQQTQGVSYLNIVRNSSSDLTQLRERLPLYQYILLDEQKGTDSGVQITLENERVKSIYLNNGKKLSQWPAIAQVFSAIRIGDRASDLFAKFVQIQKNGLYTTKFERISLLTKNIATSYDPVMTQSTQWYFAYTTPANLLELVEINFSNGQVSDVYVSRFSR